MGGIDHHLHTQMVNFLHTFQRCLPILLTLLSSHSNLLPLFSVYVAIIASSYWQLHAHWFHIITLWKNGCEHEMKENCFPTMLLKDQPIRIFLHLVWTSDLTASLSFRNWRRAEHTGNACVRAEMKASPYRIYLADTPLCFFLLAFMLRYPRFTSRIDSKIIQFTHNSAADITVKSRDFSPWFSWKKNGWEWKFRGGSWGPGWAGCVVDWLDWWLPWRTRHSLSRRSPKPST